MKLFKNYEEFLSTIITMIRDFPEESINKIRLAINVCDSLVDDKDRIYRLKVTYMDCLWRIDKAVTLGFHQYLIEEYKQTRNILEYHDINCEYDCIICQHRRITIDRLRNNNERERPQIPT
tara:strand:- start:2530 stop:2892 length:363 start_codon:yes stop_codon:yes gene_type:complete